VCTVLFRFQPGSPWPLQLAAVRDEFVDRAWDPPAAHWAAEAPGVYGGRDRTAGGTWLAVRPDRPAIACLLNGVRLPVPAAGVRPTRGTLPLSALMVGLGAKLDPDSVREYDGFHLLLGSPDGVVVWSWDGVDVVRREPAPGDHIIVNLGVDTVDDPLVPHFQPLLASAALGAGDGSTMDFWGSWVDLVRGDGLAPDDPRALIVRRQLTAQDGTGEFVGRVYGSTSASLVALDGNRVRYDFTATPDAAQWSRVL
jgi:transport and Golgi organization protein 2